MRRILRKIAAGVKDNEELGDVSTLADSTVLTCKDIKSPIIIFLFPQVVDKLIEQFSEARAKVNSKK